MFGLSTAETLVTLFLSAAGFTFSGQLTMMAATFFEKTRLLILGAGLFVLGALTAFGFAAFAIYSIANLIEKAAG